jgi:hypothetical protein
MNVTDVKLPQEFTRCRGGDETLSPDQLLCATITSHDIQIRQTLPAENQIVCQTQHRLAFGIPALALFHFQFGVQNFGDPQLFDKSLKQRHPGMAAQVNVTKTNVELPDFPNYTFSAHLLSASSWVKWRSDQPIFTTVGGFFST